MNDLYYLFFKFGPALQFVFKIGYIPQNADFKELTPEQYASYYRQTPKEESDELKGQKLLVFLPDDTSVYNKLVNQYGDQLIIVGENEKSVFSNVSAFINKCCNESGRDFKTLNDKLVYMAKTLPDVFTSETPYAIYGKCNLDISSLLDGQSKSESHDDE